MNFLKFDLGNVKKGAVAVVTLDKQANVRLLDASNFSSYRRGAKHTFYGGLATKSPARVPVPRDGHWYVVVDLGGYAGKVRAGVKVQPPPGMLKPMGNGSPLTRIRHDLPPEVTPPSGQTWDVFISHASEDKAEVARPLAEALQTFGVTVWLDAFELRIGDSLRRKIDEGLASSRFGVVVLSETFFAKGWPQYELDGLVTLTVAGEQSLLPIWHNLTKEQLLKHAPSLADRIARSTATHTVEDIAREIADVVLGRADEAS